MDYLYYKGDLLKGRIVLVDGLHIVMDDMGIITVNNDKGVAYTTQYIYDAWMYAKGMYV